MSDNRPRLWVKFKDTFFLEFAMVTPEEVTALQKKHRKISWVKHQRVTETDDDAFAEAFIRRAVTNWRGLTFRIERLLNCARRKQGDPPDNHLIEPTFTANKELDKASIDYLVKLGNTDHRFSSFVMDCVTHFQELYEQLLLAEEVPGEEEQKKALEEETKN